MDIRTRLLLAFTPLLVALALFAVVLPFGFQQTTDSLRRQQAATEDFLRGQDLALSVLAEHDEISHIVDGDASPGSARFQATRSRVESLLSAENDATDPSQGLDQAIAEQYRQLAGYHDQVVALVEEGDVAQAQAVFNDRLLDTLIDSIIGLSQEVNDTNRRTLDAASQKALMGSQQAVYLLGAAFVVAILISSSLSWLFVLQIARPLDQLAADARRYGDGQSTGQLSQVGSITQLQRLRESFQNLLDTNASREQRIGETLAEREQQLAREAQLRETVRSLSLPVVPLDHNILLLPLIGHIDEERSSALMADLLQAISERRARALVIDLTGLAVIDAASAGLLRHTVDAARLLGCSVYLVGVRASQARTLAEHQLSEAGVVTARDIPSVLELLRSVV